MSASVEAALARAGITDEKVFAVLDAGLDAKETRLVVHDGQVTDAVEVPDWHARHKFATTALYLKKYLGKEEESSGGGGLIIVAPTAVQIQNGHESSCTCLQCTATWEKKANEVMSKRKREITVDALPGRRDDLDESELLDQENFDAGGREE